MYHKKITNLIFHYLIQIKMPIFEFDHLQVLLFLNLLEILILKTIFFCYVCVRCTCRTTLSVLLYFRTPSWQHLYNRIISNPIYSPNDTQNADEHHEYKLFTNRSHFELWRIRFDTCYLAGETNAHMIPI